MNILCVRDCIYNCHGVGIRIDPVDGIYIRLGVEEDTGVNYLEITGVMEDDQGNYTCQITTPVGTLESTGVLKVNGIVNFCVHVAMYTYICTYNVYVTGFDKSQLKYM